MYYLNKANESNETDEVYLEGTYVAVLKSMRGKKLLNLV